MRPITPQWIHYFLEELLQPQIAYIRSIWQIFLFKSDCYFKVALAAIHLSGTTIISGGHLHWSSIFKGTVFLLNKHLQSFLFFIGIELIHKSICSHPLDELLFLYFKRVIEFTHSFKFTVFLKNRNCSKEILTIIIIPPWFQACIYWKKFVSWRHHFQPSIFSMIVSLFHGSTWRNPHVKETVFISQHFLQPSIIISGLWLIREKVEEYVYFRKTIVALLF